MYKHIIPVNISADGNLFGGMIKKRNAFEAAGVLLLGILIFKIFLFALPMMIKTALFIIFVVFPTVVTLIGINNQSVIELLILFISYKKKPEIYPYNIQTDASIEESVGFMEKRKAKKEAKAMSKAAKKDSYAAYSQADYTASEMMEPSAPRRSSPNYAPASKAKADKIQSKMDKKARKRGLPPNR